MNLKKTIKDGVATIPDSVKVIPDGAFQGCTDLVEVKIPWHVTRIGKRAFEGCTALSSIWLPYHLKRIGDRAFLGCSNLNRMVIPGQVTHIGDFAFAYCSGIESIELSASVSTVGVQAFLGCQAIRVLYIDLTNPDFVAQVLGVSGLPNKQNIMLLVPDEAVVPCFRYHPFFSEFADVLAGHGLLHFASSPQRIVRPEFPYTVIPIQKAADEYRIDYEVYSIEEDDTVSSLNYEWDATRTVSCRLRKRLASDALEGYLNKLASCDNVIVDSLTREDGIALWITLPDPLLQPPTCGSDNLRKKDRIASYLGTLLAAAVEKNEGSWVRDENSMHSL